MKPENWNLVDIKDGTYYIAEYIGVLDREGRSEEETEAVKVSDLWGELKRNKRSVVK